VNLNSIAAAQSAVKLQGMKAQWEIKKQGKSPDAANDSRSKLYEMHDQLEKLQKDNAVSLLDGKLRAGKELSRDELEFLKREKPELYEQALEIKRERQQYKKALESRKTKRDVQNLHFQNTSRLLTEARAIKKAPGIDSERKKALLDKIVKRMAGMQDEYARYTASEKYALLPYDEKAKTGIRHTKRKSITVNADCYITAPILSAKASETGKTARIKRVSTLRKDRPSGLRKALDLRV